MANEEIQIQISRGSDSSRRAATPVSGEPGVTTDSGHLGGFLTVGDGSTAGGVYPGAGNAHPGGPVNRWIVPPSLLLAPATAATSANVLLYVPICFPPGPARSIKNLGIQVNGAGGGGAAFRLGIYDNVDGVPTNLVLDSGSIAATSTGFKQMAAATTTAVRPGWYFIAFVTNSATATWETLSTTGYLGLIPWSSSAAKRPTVHYELHTYAALPSTASPLGVAGGAFPLGNVQIA